MMTTVSGPAPTNRVKSWMLSGVVTRPSQRGGEALATCVRSAGRLHPIRSMRPTRGSSRVTKHSTGTSGICAMGCGLTDCASAAGTSPPADKHNSSFSGATAPAVARALDREGPPAASAGLGRRVFKGVDKRVIAEGVAKEVGKRAHKGFEPLQCFLPGVIEGCLVVLWVE